MDAKMGQGRYLILILFLLPTSSLFSKEPRTFFLYQEKKEGVAQKILKSYPSDLQAASFLQEKIVLKLEGWPLIPIDVAMEPAQQEDLMGELVLHHHFKLSIKAKEEIIPLNEEESKVNEALRPYFIQEIDLKGEGDLWISKETNFVVAEKFFLFGPVLRREKREEWDLSWARGALW